MNTKILMIAFFFTAFSIQGFAQENDVNEAKATINEFKETDSGISKYFSSAYGYVVFPGIGKGGLGVGGAGGKGTVFKGGSAVADAKMSQITVGFQAGSFISQKLLDQFEIVPVASQVSHCHSIMRLSCES